MDWVCKAILTVLSVALVLALARRFGGGAAGFIAGLPFTTAPALLWLAQDHGPRFAADAAIVTVAGCAALAVFALIYAHAALWRGVGTALVCGSAGAALFGLLALSFGRDLPAASALAVVCCGLALAGWPRATRPSAARRAVLRPWRSMTITSASAGGLSVGVAMAGPLCGIVATGLLSSLPVVSLSVAVAEQAAGGTAAVLQFLRGYVAGLFGRVAFGAVFVLALGDLGPLGALGLAGLCAGVVNLALARRLHGATAGRRQAAA